MFNWNDKLSTDDVLNTLTIKSIVPNSLIWLPFQQPLVDYALARLFRVSFSNNASTLIVCPWFESSKFLQTLAFNNKHGSIFLSNPTNFCPFLCVLLFLNCTNAPHVQVSNNVNGNFDFHSANHELFHPMQSDTLIANIKTDANMEFIPHTEKLLKHARALEALRKSQLFQCPLFPILPVNDFITRSFSFDVTSIQFHSDPTLIQSLFPKKLFLTPAKKRPISYQRYNEMCEDDSKITPNKIPAEDLFCSSCGKLGHSAEFCWMRIRSSKALGLTSRVDIVLNDFILSLTRAPSFKHKSSHESIIDFVTNLLFIIHKNANFFTTSWTTFANRHRVRADLVEPGFSQLRQGLPYWYAIACPIYVLQWVAFDIPVFWQCTARPPPFEVRPKQTNNKPTDSSSTTLKAVRKFLDMNFILPILRKQIHCCAPLFDKTSSGKMRSIHDLRLVNRYIMAIKFSLFTAFNFCNLASEG